MKRSEFKLLVKECLVEILRDNMEIFTESAKPRSRKAAKKARSNGNAKMKRTLMTLLSEESPPQPRPTPRPMGGRQAPPQQKQQQQQQGGFDIQSLIASAASTMQQQNSMGEMGSRGAATMYESRTAPPPPAEDPGYGSYGTAPVPHAPTQQMGGGVGVPLPQPPIPGGNGGDGESYWSKLAFFDQ